MGRAHFPGGNLTRQPLEPTASMPALTINRRQSPGVEVRELPRGTVTFVFTDIEGSTRLLASLGSGFEQA